MHYVISMFFLENVLGEGYTYFELGTVNSQLVWKKTINFKSSQKKNVNSCCIIVVVWFLDTSIQVVRVVRTLLKSIKILVWSKKIIAWIFQKNNCPVRDPAALRGKMLQRCEYKLNQNLSSFKVFVQTRKSYWKHTNFERCISGNFSNFTVGQKMWAFEMFKTPVLWQ